MPSKNALLTRIILILAVCAACSPPVLRSEISTEEQRKRELFLRAREDIVPSPAATPIPARPEPRPRPASSPHKSSPRPRTTPHPSESKEKPTPKTTPHATPKEIVEKLPPPHEAEPPPSPSKKDIFPIPREQPSTTPKPTPAPSVAPTEHPAAPITIEKSGAEEDQGLQPTPKPERRGFFGFGAPRYRHLTRGVRAAIDRAPVKRSRWQYIIIHNSGTRQGNARIFDNYHRNVRRMQNGLAYHFVIGNGTSSGDGEIEIGSRWTRQINGGHVASDYLNDISIGICLVGDYNRDRPTEAQLNALDELIRYLRTRVGKTKGHASTVKAHREINPKPTDCPGSRFPYRWLHRRFD